MWDSLNGTLLPTACGASSPYIGLGLSPYMGMGGSMIPPVPMSYGGAMFPGAFGGGMMPYDTFTSQAPVPPLKAHGGELAGHGEGGGISGFLGGAAKIGLGIAAVVLGFKGVKALKNRIPRPSAK